MRKVQIKMPRIEPLMIASSKSNFGHLEGSAAAIAMNKCILVATAVPHTSTSAQPKAAPGFEEERSHGTGGTICRCPRLQQCNSVSWVLSAYPLRRSQPMRHGFLAPSFPHLSIYIFLSLSLYIYIYIMCVCLYIYIYIYREREIERDRERERDRYHRS